MKADFHKNIGFRYPFCGSCEEQRQVTLHEYINLLPHKLANDAHMDSLLDVDIATLKECAETVLIARSHRPIIITDNGTTLWASGERIEACFRMRRVTRRLLMWPPPRAPSL